MARNNGLLSSSEQRLNAHPDLSSDQRDRFISLAKKAGMTCKQVQPIVNISPKYLRQKWIKVPYTRVPRKLKVHNAHKGIILELLLEAEIDIYTISGIFNYTPVTVLQFLETEGEEGNWKVRQCRICRDPFVTFDERRVCQRISCIEEDRSAKKHSENF